MNDKGGHSVPQSFSVIYIFLLLHLFVHVEAMYMVSSEYTPEESRF